MAVDTKRMDEASIWWARECPATADLLGTAAVEIDTLRRALVEAGRCVECGGHGRVCVSVACVECGATGIRADLTPETRAAVKAAREAING